MKRVIHVILLLMITHNLIGQNDRVQIKIPSPENECSFIWRNIRDITFFDQNGYSVSFPDDIFIEKLLNQSRKNQLVDGNYDTLLRLIRNEVYKQEDYQKGYLKINEVLPLINQAIENLQVFQDSWGFTLFPQYEINLTLYGPGGSYNPDRGEVLLMTTASGRFKGYNNPANTIIHEVIHIGIEQCIVQEYHLSHQLKERVVDLFVQICFSDKLTDYRLQSFGDKRIDSYIQNKDDLKNLPAIIKGFMRDHQIK